MRFLISRLKAVRVAFDACYRSLYLEKTSEVGVYKVEKYRVKTYTKDSLKNFFEVKFGLNLGIFDRSRFQNFRKMIAKANENDVTHCFKKHVPNDLARGIKKLDRTLFSCTVKVMGIAVPNSAVEKFRKVFKTSVVRLPNVKPVANLRESDPLYDSHKLALLDSSVYNIPDDFTSKFSDQLEQMTINKHLCKFYDLELDYSNWNYDEILKWILPKEEEAVGGFSIIGHIAHLNLKDELLEYKEIIGEVILDKVSCVKTVVNKLQTIDNTYRNFKMEVLAGEEKYITITKEHGFTYELDFSKIYWNPRLSTEHQRIAALTSSGDIVFDVFAGIGPFSIPCAKKNCQVYANDLNPNSVYWLNKNLKHNKIPDERIEVFNLDGRDFIRNIVKKELKKLLFSAYNDKISSEKSIHIPMNLPALAVEFLDAFPGLLAERDDANQSSKAPESTLDDFESIMEYYKNPEFKNESNIVVHCYCFSKEEDPENDVILRIKDVLKLDSLSLHDAGIKRVRNVAPNKEMLCASFKLPWDLLFQKRPDLSANIDGECDFESEPKSKRIKL